MAGNIGGHSRVKYAVFGDAVNVATRAEQLNREISTELLLSEDTFRRLPEELRAKGVDKGEHEVKGRAGRVRFWTV